MLFFLIHVVDRHRSSTTAASSERPFAHRMCEHVTAADYHSRTIRGSFNKTTVWEDCVLEHALYDLGTATTSLSTLDHFLQGLSTQTKCRSNAGTRNLDRLSRKIVGLHLAYSLFQLCGSPWLQHGFEGENIFVLPSKTSGIQLHCWRPHVYCDLSSPPIPRSLPEDVAALGVLILELEANLSAGWTDDDEDYETETKSHKARLSRILKEWKGELPDRYYSVGSACFRFEQLVEDFDNPKINESLRSLAVLYKGIVNPLFRQLVSDFGVTERLFQGVSGLSIPTRQKRASATGRFVLYDDLESTEPDKKSKFAEELMTTLENGFLKNILALRHKSIGLAETLKGTPKRIRIAVLDTGIDPTDNMIKAAMKSSNMKSPRIISKRSWVGSDENCNDTYGHGTHVTRLLLQMAPAAEIYVAKITDNKNVHPEDMLRIAEAIDWAVEKWNVDIISMSFGFENQNKAIDDAIERAFKADKLMFAAASNEGGNKGRSRPGRNPNVICIHACDGKGNKGDMSPNPMKKKDNFTALGVAVKSRWKKITVYKSGTSFATPVAAAIAANVLEFANFKCELLERKQLLYKRDGMLEVFRAMSTERDNYDYVQPGHLWNSIDGDEELARTIKRILAEL
ncbi:peptidase S8/S53 domain-containing protein [Ilyonectria sp. MPI-CAGE-AT-0026]|nr:peptidase S8/S53 domain-containing protein [Ilyonectria sp. MPI-CAGE-AT-0026]